MCALISLEFFFPLKIETLSCCLCVIVVKRGGGFRGEFEGPVSDLTPGEARWVWHSPCERHF